MGMGGNCVSSYCAIALFFGNAPTPMKCNEIPYQRISKHKLIA